MAWEVPIGAAIAFAAGAIGTARAQSRIGPAGRARSLRTRKLMGSMIILLAIPETLVILGFVVAAMIIFMI